MLFYIAANNVIIPMINAEQINKMIVMSLNFAITMVVSFAGYSIFMASGLWNHKYQMLTWINEIFWSTPVLLTILSTMCGLSLYLLNDISEDIFGRINVKMDKLNKDISIRDEEIYRLYSILTEVEKLYLEGKPDASNIFEDTTHKFARLEEIVEKIKNVRESRTLTIDIELTKKVN
jgi:hypothetical protein